MENFMIRVWGSKQTSVEEADLGWMAAWSHSHCAALELLRQDVSSAPVIQG